MATMFVRHRVADYATFRTVYDRLAATRKAHNVSPSRTTVAFRTRP